MLTEPPAALRGSQGRRRWLRWPHRGENPRVNAVTRIICLLLLGLLVAAPLRAAELRATITPGLTELPLSPHVGYYVDPDGSADASSMFQAAGQGRFKPLPNGNATFGFRDGAYWFHTRLFNRGNPEE